MIAVNTDIVERIIKNYVIEIEAQRSTAESKLKKMKNNLPATITPAEKDYLDEIITLFADTEIITCKPSDLNDKMKSIGEVPKVKCTGFNFKDKILECLGYKGLRSNFYPQYFREIGIKTCVYCNSQLTVSVESYYKKLSAKFQVDHFRSKADYPFLSISLYNLYPVCASCNLIKGKKPVRFELYSEQPKDSPYRFELEVGCVAKYFINNQGFNELNFKFIDPEKPDENIVEGSLQDTFEIQGIYNTQKDIIEELVVKSQIYSDSYKQSLIRSFPNLFAKHGLSNRIFLGNYDNPNDIHKRPMAKFMQDIARDLNLIK